MLVVYNSHLSSKKEGLSDDLVNIKKEVAIYEAKAKQVEEIKKKLDTLNKQIEVVNLLKEYREKPPQLLAKMTEVVISGRMQLTRLVSNDTNMKLEGVALDNETVAVFMLRLERSGLFSGVTLASSKQVEKYNVNMKQFNIKCKKAVAKKEVPVSK